jgi:twitching motility protein PilU
MSFDQSLLALYKSGQISLETAMVNADSASDLEWKINFGGGVDDSLNDADSNGTLEFPGSSAESKDN